MTNHPTMRALVLNDYTDGTFIDTQVPRSVAGPGQVLVRIVASGVNPIDYKIRTGVAPYAEPELPAILGTELAGVVEALGEGVTSFKVGDEVYGMTGGVRGLPGSLAEYAAVYADLLAPKPRNLTGMIVLGVIAFFRGGLAESLSIVPSQPAWRLVGGVLGAGAIFCTVWLAPRIGLANLLVLVIAPTARAVVCCRCAPMAAPIRNTASWG